MTKSTNQLLSAFAFLIAWSQVALADSRTETREEKEKAAKKACITGDVGRGIDILGDLFVEQNEIVYVFNQARCYQQNHRWQEALDRFAEYQRKARYLPADQQTELDRYIADCKAHLGTGELPPTVPALPPPAPGQPVQADLPVQPVSTVATESPPAQPRGRGLRLAGIVVGGVGVAAVAAGIVMAAKTRSLTDDIHKNGYDPDKLSSRDSYETWGWMSYGVGAAGIVAGTALYLWGRSSASGASAQLSLLPVVGPAGAGLMLRGGL